MDQEKRQRADIIISGAGIAGLTLASILAKSGFQIHIIEPHLPTPVKKTAVTGRTVALMQSSLNVLKAAGIEQFFNDHGTKMEVMRIIDDSIPNQKHIVCEFDSFDIGFPYFSMNLPNNLLRSTLFEHIQTFENVTVHHTALRRFLTTPIVQVELENGEFISAQLIIGADGRQSKVREIAGIKSVKKDYQQSALTCVINHSKSHNFTSTEFHRSGGPFALVPMQGNQSSVVWVAPTEKAESYLKLSKDSFEKVVQERTNDILGAITLETPPECYPLCSIKANTLTARRVALIAEAAHVMSPITAQGLNLSLRDVATLCETIIDSARLGQDIGNNTTLRNYEKRRSFDIKTRVFGVDQMNKIVSTNHQPSKDTRRIGLKILNKNSFLRTLAMNHGLAPSLDKGRIIEGKSL